MLNRKLRYLQIALNSTLEEASAIISQLPVSDRIIIEAGTPLIKTYGEYGIRQIRNWWELRMGLGLQFGLSEEAMIPKGGLLGLIFPQYRGLMEKLAGSQYKKVSIASPPKPERGQQNIGQTIGQNVGRAPLKPYIVADTKCMDRGATEVEIAWRGGANAATACGHAPIETLNAFIARCEELGLDAMIDMMNVEYPLSVLRQLKKAPPVVILHRGVDEEQFNREKQLPYHEIHRIKGAYNIMIAMAGGDTIREVQRAVFNDIDIAVVWKSFYASTAETAQLAEEFLKEVK